MKGQLFAIVAIFGLSVYTASIPAPDGAKFEYVEPETVAEHFNSKPTVRGKRTVGGIYICTGEYWTGQCGYAVQPLNTCIRLDYPWWHSISSFGPDEGTVCAWYSDYNCSEKIASDIGYPGIDDMDHPAEGCENNRRGVDHVKRCHGNQVGSFRCRAA